MFLSSIINIAIVIFSIVVSDLLHFLIVIIHIFYWGGGIRRPPNGERDSGFDSFFGTSHFPSASAQIRSFLKLLCASTDDNERIRRKGSSPNVQGRTVSSVLISQGPFSLTLLSSIVACCFVNGGGEGSSAVGLSRVSLIMF